MWLYRRFPLHLLAFTDCDVSTVALRMAESEKSCKQDRREFVMKQFLVLVLIGLMAWSPSFAKAQYDSRVRDDGRVVLPTGTEISIRTNETIDSRNDRVGQTFNAQVAQDVLGSSGEVLIPKGSDASLILRQISSGGTTGSPELALDLDSMTVQGRRYTVSTTDLEKRGNQGIGKNRRTAEMVGGGAALGTLLGAIAGGGKGAVIGAVAGAAAGGTAQVLTKGKEVKVPAETVLKFKLDQPLDLRSTSY